jgi:hypothetical protein
MIRRIAPGLLALLAAGVLQTAGAQEGRSTASFQDIDNRLNQAESFIANLESPERLAAACRDKMAMSEMVQPEQALKGKVMGRFRDAQSLYYICRAAVSAQTADCNALSPIPAESSETSARADCATSSVQFQWLAALLAQQPAAVNKCEEFFRLSEGRNGISAAAAPSACQAMAAGFRKPETLCSQLSIKYPAFKSSGCRAFFATVNGDNKPCRAISAADSGIDREVCDARVALAQASARKEAQRCEGSGLCEAALNHDARYCRAYEKRAAALYCSGKIRIESIYTMLDGLDQTLNAIEPKTSAEYKARAGRYRALRAKLKSAKKREGGAAQEQ